MATGGGKDPADCRHSAGTTNSQSTSSSSETKLSPQRTGLGESCLRGAGYLRRGGHVARRWEGAEGAENTWRQQRTVLDL